MPAHGVPGVLFIGVKDDGTPAGTPVTDELLTAIAQMRNDGTLQPIPDIEERRRDLRGQDVAVMEVRPVSQPPARWKGQTWIRVSPVPAIATIDQERRLTGRRVSGAQTFDQRPCVDAAIGDLYLPPFRDEYLPRVESAEVLAENGRTVPEQLASLRFFDLKRDLPAYAGEILFGVDPLSFVPGCYVQVVRYGGLGVTDALAACAMRRTALANATPSKPARAVKRKHSVRSWGISRERDDPQRKRMAFFLRLASARASKRFMRLAHAMTSTSTTATNNRNSGPWLV